MKKILVCDDAVEILEVINIILTDAGYEIKTLDESIRVVEEIKTFKPDLVLLDLWIKNFDGRDVAKQIQADEETAKTPIFFVSALNELDKIAEEANVQGFIRKPFEMDDLLQKISTVLGSDNRENS